MTTRIAVSLSFLLLILPSLRGSDISLPYGGGPGQVGFLNEGNHPDYIGIPLPLGPQAFRMDGERVWVLDSIQGRLLQIDPAGKVLAQVVAVAASGPQSLGDFALTRTAGGAVDGFWVSDRLTQELLRLDLSGNRLLKVGGAGNPVCPFQDVRRIEVGPSGRLYVADEGLENIVVLRPDGSVIKKIPDTGRGFFLDSREMLNQLTWDEETQKAVWRRTRLDGTAEPEIKLGLPLPNPPELWFALPNGDLLITFFAKAPFEGPRQLAFCQPSGVVRGILDLAVPQQMVRFLEPGTGDFLWTASGDFSKAPAGAFSIKPFLIGGPPEG